MLRLNVYCSLVPSPRQFKLRSNSGSWVIRTLRAERISVKALRDEMNGGTSGSPGRSWDHGLEMEVPFEQRPVNEYKSLKDGGLYSWGELSPGSFLLRLGGLWLVTFTVLGVPIAAASFNPSKEPLRFGLAAGIGTLFLVSLIVLRIYLGWSYVGDRLLSAVIPYEESGWYDGQMWVKPPEILARDRLLGSYKVKPVIKLLKQTLVGTGALLVTAVFLFIFATPAEDFIQNTFHTNGNHVAASKISTRFNIRKEELLRLPVEVKADDDLAAAAAEAADGRPVYCRDRYYRALAGGQYCKWEDLIGHRFLIETDMSSFPQMLKFKQKALPPAQLLRWANWFSQWNFDAIHIKGKHKPPSDSHSLQKTPVIIFRNPVAQVVKKSSKCPRNVHGSMSES